MADGKVVVVTGATSGIGRAAALGFAAAGYRVAVCGRRQAALDAVVAEGGLALGGQCDVTDPAEVSAFFDDIVRQLGRIDVVFNNAGRSSPSQPIGDVDIDTWRQVVDTNLNGAFYVAREAFRAMRAQSPQGGRIINNGSISAYTPRAGSAAYTASKHAVLGLTKAISLDGRPFNIACGQIDIGNTLTDMTKDMSAGMPQADGSMKQEPTFDVRHVVEALLYMASLPLGANVQNMTVMATTMPFVGRG